MAYVWSFREIRYSNLLLCGFMGAGKTRLLKHLRKSGPEEIQYLDLDRVIVEKSGSKSILKLMKALGEEHFRALENEILMKMMGEGGHLLSLGGGALNKGLNEAIRKRGDILVIWVDTPLEQCLANLKKDHKNVRPLMKHGEDFVRNLYRKRRETYSTAPVRLDWEALSNFKTYSLFIGEVERQLFERDCMKK